VKFEAASLLATSYSQAGNAQGAMSVLSGAMEQSPGSEYWHCRLVLQVASLHTSLQDYTSAHAALQQGADYAFMQRAYYTRTLFVLSKSLLFLCERRFQEANPLLQQVSPDIENWVVTYQAHLGPSMAASHLHPSPDLI